MWQRGREYKQRVQLENHRGNSPIKRLISAKTMSFVKETGFLTNGKQTFSFVLFLFLFFLIFFFQMEKNKIEKVGGGTPLASVKNEATILSHCDVFPLKL